jgi:hypothetical protein
MTHPVALHDRRRSQRIPHSVPLFVTSLDAPLTFVGKVQTVEVSGHGCLIHAPRPFPHGTRCALISCLATAQSPHVSSTQTRWEPACT